MRVFYDHQIFVRQQFGGISRYFNELAKIENNGIQVETLDASLASINFGKRTDFYSRGLDYLKRQVGFQKGRGKEKVAVRIREKIEVTPFDIFHPTYYDPYFLDYLKKPFVLTVYDMVHEIYQEYFSISDTTSRNKRLLCERASAIIAISENTKKDLIDIFKVPAEKIHAIQLASDFDKLVPVSPVGGEGLEKFILFTGNRWGYKNFYFCATALAEILKSDPELKLVCTGHPFTADENSFFKDLGIQHQVTYIYLKNDQELAWIYRKAALFVFPSLCEGFGFPVLEAFASDCPVISSDGGSLPEVGGDGALYFNPKKILEIQDRAHLILNNEAVKKELVKKGTAMFKKFSWEKCRMETAEVYKTFSRQSL